MRLLALKFRPHERGLHGAVAVRIGIPITGRRLRISYAGFRPNCVLAHAPQRRMRRPTGKPRHFASSLSSLRPVCLRLQQFPKFLLRVCDAEFDGLRRGIQHLRDFLLRVAFDREKNQRGAELMR